MESQLIENGFMVDGAYFDVGQLARARQAIEDGEVGLELQYPRPLLLPEVCANIIDYQLAVTIFPADNEERINEIFGRINSGGRQLSDQDKRQAGSVSAFNEIVRTIASKIRGDDSQNPVDLRVMPAISIELPMQAAGYAIRAQEVFWCRQGIVRATELRQSADEQVIADLLAAMLFEDPIENNAEALNEIYDPDTDLGQRADRTIIEFDQDVLVKQFLSIIDVTEEVVKAHRTQSAFRDIVYPRRTSNPMRASFHAFFCAVNELIFKRSMKPIDFSGIAQGIDNIHARLETARGAVSAAKRKANINTVLGNIQDHFQRTADTSVAASGINAVTELRATLLRAGTEIGRVECKQGIYSLDGTRVLNEDLMQRLVQTACGIANSNPVNGGMILLGVADDERDARRVEGAGGNEASVCGRFWVVGVDHETQDNADHYLRRIVERFRGSELSEPLKTAVLSSIETIMFHGKTIVKINIPPQIGMSTVGDDVFYREGNATERASARKAMNLQRAFAAANEANRPARRRGG
jgi:Schlafen, AlbA_2